MTRKTGNKNNYRELVGLIPAGGRANRLAPLPCSKELYPVGFRSIDESGSLRPKVVSHYLLEKMQLSGVTKTYIILRNGKWDIPAYYGDGRVFNMHLAYLMMGLPFGVPYTLEQAYPFVQNSLIVFGFPDIIFQPETAFVELINRQKNTGADVVLGIFSADQSQKWDIVNLDDNGRIMQITTNPKQNHMNYTWAIAVWTPVFTHFMHNYIISIQGANADVIEGDNVAGQKELSVGDVIQAAIEDNLSVEGVLFSEYPCVDIGTPDDLVKFIQNMN